MPGDAAAHPAERSHLRLTRGITATWWYTAAGILALEAMVTAVWVLEFHRLGSLAAALLPVGIGGLVWVATTVPLLLRYRRPDAARRRPETGIADPDSVRTAATEWAIPLAAIVAAAGCGVAAHLATGLWIVAVYPLAQTLALFKWPRGVRLRVTLTSTLLLVILFTIDFSETLQFNAPLDALRPLPGLFAIMLPSMTVFSLWWWDVVRELDRARAAESRLGATQERLRIATDVHDLQGHHLQVIALQLELTERLLARDPEMALSHLQTARASVDEARHQTRELAMGIRAVPIEDEIANAVDLLQAAGYEVENAVEPGASSAAAAVLRPVIRETTTNVLRHGGGQWARLTLARDGSMWRYEVANDRAPGASDSVDGSGLSGIARRVEEVGGTRTLHGNEQTFCVTITVPGGNR